MKKLIFLLFLMLPIGAQSQNILSAEVMATPAQLSGSLLRVRISGAVTNQTFAMGLGNDNGHNTVTGDSADPKIILTVIGQRFETNWTTTTVTQTMWATFPYRFPHPDHALKYTFKQGSDVDVYVVLNEYIYAGETVTADIKAGFYTSGGTPNNQSLGVSVVNSSDVTSRPTKGAWTDTDRTMVTGTFNVRAFASHREARDGRLLYAAQFVATDGTTSKTNNSLAMTTASYWPTKEFKASYDFQGTFDANDFAQGSTITVNVYFIPWRTTNILTSFGSTLSLFQPQKFVCNKTGAIDTPHALVDPQNGSDSGALTVYTAAAYNRNTAYKFATPTKAIRAIRDFNVAQYGRDNYYGKVELTEGTYATALGPSVSGGYGGVPEAYVIVEPVPAAARANVLFTGAGSTMPTRVHLKGVKVTSTAAFTFNGITDFLVEGAEFATSQTALITSTPAGRWALKHCKLTDFGQGLQPAVNQNYPCWLSRGNDLSGFSKTITVTTIFACWRTNRYQASTFARLFIAGQTAPVHTPIFAYNYIDGWRNDNAATVFNFETLGPFTNGAAIVHNLMVNTSSSLASLGDIGSSESSATNTPIDDIDWLYNEGLGGRIQFGYNSALGVLKYRRYWSVKNNFMDVWGRKGDTFIGSPSGVQVGNHAIMFGVGHSGNIDASIDESGGSSTFAPDFSGIYSHQSTGTTNTPSWPQFLNPLRWNGTSGDVGGDYRLTSTSPLLGMAFEKLLPGDFDGTNRVAGVGAVGVYEYVEPFSPIIISHPQSQTVIVGQDVTFTVVVTGDPFPTLQWRKGGVNISGETTDELVISDVETGDAGSYDVVATNSSGSATSNTAVLSINESTVTTTIFRRKPFFDF